MKHMQGYPLQVLPVVEEDRGHLKRPLGYFNRGVHAAGWCPTASSPGPEKDDLQDGQPHENIKVLRVRSWVTVKHVSVVLYTRDALALNKIKPSSMMSTGRDFFFSQGPGEVVPILARCPAQPSSLSSLVCSLERVGFPLSLGGP